MLKHIEISVGGTSHHTHLLIIDSIQSIVMFAASSLYFHEDNVHVNLGDDIDLMTGLIAATPISFANGVTVSGEVVGRYLFGFLTPSVIISQGESECFKRHIESLHTMSKSANGDEIHACLTISTKSIESDTA